MTIVRTDDGWVVQAAELRVIAVPFGATAEAWRGLRGFDYTAGGQAPLTSLCAPRNREVRYAAQL